MISIIAGKKGTGKTKTIIDLANKAVASESGIVVVIERGEKLRYDINHDARLINSKEYEISGYDNLFGFINGIAAANYDITHIFIDSIYKVVGDENPAPLDEFIKKLENLNQRTSIAFTMTVSDEVQNLGDTIKKYIIEH